jgi:hypothetical protein
MSQNRHMTQSGSPLIRHLGIEITSRAKGTFAIHRKRPASA